MKRDKLKGLMVAQRKSYAYMAGVAGMSTTSFSNKMLGRTLFDVAEATLIANDLKLSLADRCDIFLS